MSRRRRGYATEPAGPKVLSDDSVHRCRWSDHEGRCRNVGEKTQHWDGGKASRLCEHHWTKRDEMRPASSVYAMEAISVARRVWAQPKDVADSERIDVRLELARLAAKHRSELHFEREPGEEG